eukprot:6312007-Lingulodinium_polyedra.AAC.1
MSTSSASFQAGPAQHSSQSSEKSSVASRTAAARAATSAVPRSCAGPKPSPAARTLATAGAV